MGIQKVFGIGFHKTGTTSLGAALQILGYKVCPGARPVRRLLGNRRMMDLLSQHRLDPILQVAEYYQAFVDNPWFMLYRELDQRFPGSRFILTIRDEAQWLSSVLDYFGRSESDFREWIYGARNPAGHEQRYVQQYRSHNENVSAYFRDRREQLLIVDWSQGSDWAQLSAFLGRTPPQLPFPHIRPQRSASCSEEDPWKSI